ncbi:MAG: CD1375 family protein [Atopobiaceae bacterium]|jgi:hypothetical protein|nr:CD1375 family protein [Atopobiaceae bacterium]
MVKWYVKRIRAGKMTLDEVPALWHDKVKAAMEMEAV